MYFNAKKQNKTNYISLKNKVFENIVGEKIYSRCSPDESLRKKQITRFASSGKNRPAVDSWEIVKFYLG
jgi:hypothetical protein